MSPPSMTMPVPVMLPLRPPFKIRDLSRAVAAQIAGSVVVWFADPDILDDPVGEPGRSLMSRYVLAIFEQLTEPEHPGRSDPARSDDRHH
jgi:hypothetical protein